MKTVVALVLLALCSRLASSAQPADDSLYRPKLAPRATGPQVADTGFRPDVPRPAFSPGGGPKVMLDEAHANYHTADGRFAPFVQFIRRDGFVVESSRNKFTSSHLATAKILVIANALAERNRDSWTLPTPSAFTSDEINAVREWVSSGGALFLIADHMPFPGAAAELAEAFGILMINGYATDQTGTADEFVFQRADGTLADHPITRGRDASERIDSIRTFTGQAFRSLGSADPLLVLSRRTIILMPTQAWRFDEQTPRLPAEGLLQGAAVPFGKGRVAVFGEAAMFTAQVSGPQKRPMGMNDPGAAQNPQFLLNIMRWLAGSLSER